jgi:hypothetical protein
MKIEEILIESQQLQEGPVGDVAKKIAKGAGKAIGGVGKVAGAIAGIPGGVKRAFQQGKQASQDVIGGTGQGADAPAPVGTAVPAQQTAAPAATPAPTAQQINQQGPSGTAPVKSISGMAKQAIQKTAQAVKGTGSAKAGETLYAQVKSQVNQLDKKGKQRIMQLLQKSLADPAAQITTPQATPAADSAAPDNTMANTPVSATNTASADNPNQPQTKKRGGRVAGADLSQTPDAIRKRNARRDKKNAAATTGGAGVFNQMGQQVTKQNAGIERSGNRLAETMAHTVQEHEQRMFKIDADRARLMGTNSESAVKKERVMAESFSLYRK